MSLYLPRHADFRGAAADQAVSTHHVPPSTGLFEGDWLEDKDLEALFDINIHSSQSDSDDDLGTFIV